jgi:hypothetical protein
MHGVAGHVPGTARNSFNARVPGHGNKAVGSVYCKKTVAHMIA